MKFNLKTGLFAATAVLATFPSFAHAQVGEGADEERSATISEVVVTASRRETLLQSTPIAVTAVSGKEIQDAGVTSTGDLNRIAPTVQFSQSNGVPQIFVRGIGLSQVSLGGEGGVATHIDGTYLGRPVHVNSALYDLERVEVLRGPQGTLYGRNATGGSINFITASPTSTPQGYAFVTAGNYDAFRFEGAASGPLVDGVEARLAMVYDVHDGYTKNLVTGDPVGQPETYATRLVVRVAPEGAPWDLRIAADYLKTTGDPAVFKRRQSYGLPNAVPGGRFTDEPWKIYSNSDVIGNRELSGVNATLNWDFGWASLKSITSGRQGSIHRSADVDASDLNTFESLYGYAKSKQFSQELQLLSKTDGRLEWVAGAYFFDEMARDTGPFHIDLNFGNLANPVLVPFNLGARARQYTRAYAVFGQVSYEITDRLRATVGLRYSDEEKKIASLLLAEFPTLPALTSVTTADLRDSWNAWTPKFGLEYELEDTFLYASLARGFKAGGFNSSTPAQKVPYDPEYIWTFEVGVKRDWLDGRLRTNLAVFSSRYTDLQVTQYINATSIITNAAKAKIDGAELEVVFKPVEGLTLNGAFAYLDTAYRKTNPPFQLRDGVTGLFTDMSGKPLPFSPEISLSLGLEYRHPAPSLGGELVFDTTYDWRDDSHLDVLTMPTETQQAYGITNARLAYVRSDGKLELAIFGRNIFDKAYYTTLLRAHPTINGPVGYQNAPRTFGAQLRLRY
jgi:iron complex outermembrane receptor protein